MEIVLPFFQSKSLRQPHIQLKGADYSAFAKFEKTAPEPPDHLKDHFQGKWASSPKPFLYTDVREILTNDLAFHASERYTGIQLVDIVASAISRACNKKLQLPGWESIGRLMVQREKPKSTLRLISLQDLNLPSGYELPYNDVIKKCDRDCKQMLTSSAFR